MAKNKADLLIHAKQVVTLGEDPSPRKGKDMEKSSAIQQSSLAIKDGNILAVGPTPKITSEYSAGKIFECQDSCVTPGLVDAHTHLVFAGSRERDFFARIAGVSYEEIAKRGGGIRDSVRQLRKASSEDLIDSSLKRLQQILSHGTTTCEVKSGYGLNLKDEIKTLEAIQKLSKMQPVELIPTFLGAHEIPDEFQENRQGYINLLCDEIMPKISEKKLARFCDIFCEKDVFTIEESRKILERARELDFSLKLHVDELAENFGGAELAADLKSLSADHLVLVSEKGIKSLAQSDTVSVLLPATTFFLGKERYAPARDLINQGASVALATDLNPGSSNTESMQVVMTLAALKLKMSPEEIIMACTHNSACAIGENHRVGRLGKGLLADLVIWDVSDYQKIPYHFGGNRARMVFKKGKLVYKSH